MLDFVILCIDDFKILKMFKLSKFSHDFSPRNVTGDQPPPPPPNVHMTFLVDKIDM